MNNLIIDIAEYCIFPPVLLSGSYVIRQLSSVGRAGSSRRGVVSINVGLELMNIFSSSKFLYALNCLHHTEGADPDQQHLETSLMFLFTFVIELFLLNALIVGVKQFGTFKISGRAPLYAAVFYLLTLLWLLLYTKGR